MPVENLTPNRSYKLPNQTNALKFDVARIVDTLLALDVDVAGLISSLAAKAPLLNAALTGSPTAPTPSLGDSSDRLATTQFVQGFLYDFVGAAPEALNTIVELAEALHNNPDIINELLTLVGSKLTKDQNLADLPDKAAARTNLGANDASNLNAGALPAARFTDVSHGNRGGGPLHAAATDAADGFMSAADKAKLDGLTLLGVGQTWQDVLASRVMGTSYQNTTGKPIMVCIRGSSSGTTIQVSNDGTAWITLAMGVGGSYSGMMGFIVPVGGYYRIIVNTASNWAELR